jgi:putative tryptophan/tyrosine transport system permease protein
MTWVALQGVLELGLIYGLVGLGVYLSFRVLQFPDLTVDGSFPLGGAVAAALIVKGVPPIVATGAAIGAGTIAGVLTAYLTVRLKILNLLASILVMIGLYSINLRIMGQPNVPLLGQPTIFSQVSEGFPSAFANDMLLGAIVLSILVGLNAFLATEQGLALRATGANPRMALAQGIAVDRLTLMGMGLSNGLAALAGALFAQLNGFADVTLGVGTIVLGLAAVIVGETLLPGRSSLKATVGTILGALLYRLIIAIALNSRWLGLAAQDLNLITAVIVGLALVLPRWRSKLG